MQYNSFIEMVVDNNWSKSDVENYYDNWLNTWLSSGYNNYSAQDNMLNAERYLEELKL